jgi:RNA polymerase sigma factor (sigma-70 family)
MVPALESLTPREREVLSCLTTGGRTHEIAQQLGISPRTVQKHFQRIFQKLSVKSRTAAVLLICQTR